MLTYSFRYSAVCTKKTLFFLSCSNINFSVLSKNIQHLSTLMILACFKTKSFTQFFSKNCEVQEQSACSLVATSETPLKQKYKIKKSCEAQKPFRCCGTVVPCLRPQAACLYQKTLFCLDLIFATSEMPFNPKYKIKKSCEAQKPFRCWGTAVPCLHPQAACLYLKNLFCLDLIFATSETPLNPKYKIKKSCGAQ